MPTVETAVAFLEKERVLQEPSFAASEGHYVLSFLGTTSARGITPSLSLHRLIGLKPTEAGFTVELAGQLPRPPFAGESVTVSLTDWLRYRGYQLKTAAVDGGGPGPLHHAASPDRFSLQASQVYTVHHSPNEVHMFETVPVEDVLETARAVPVAVVGVGTAANISPRFLTCFEVVDGTLALFHGDGAANKTWMNLQQNTAASRIAFDLEDQTGFLFEGPCEEISSADAPQAHREVQVHHLRMGYGPPSRVYRQLVRRIAAV